MTLRQLQIFTNKFNLKHFTKIVKERSKVENLLISTVGLAGEVGEVANLIKKYAREEYGSIRKKGDESRNYLAEAGEELVDAFYMLLVLAGKLDVDLEKGYWKNIKKIEKKMEKTK